MLERMEESEVDMELDQGDGVFVQDGGTVSEDEERMVVGPPSNLDEFRAAQKYWKNVQSPKRSLLRVESVPEKSDSEIDDSNSSAGSDISSDSDEDYLHYNRRMLERIEQSLKGMRGHFLQFS